MSCLTSSAAGRRWPIRRRAEASWGWTCAKTPRACRSSMSPASAVSPMASPTSSASSSGPATSSTRSSSAAARRRSPLVRQIIADVCGKTVEAPETAEPVLLGSAMIGAVAAGTQTLASAMGSMSTIARRGRPRGRGDRGVPRPKASRARDPAPGRAGYSPHDSEGPLARSRHFRLRRRAGRQRGDRARRDPAPARRGRPSPER